jgi:hypothetical protein
MSAIMEESSMISFLEEGSKYGITVSNGSSIDLPISIKNLEEYKSLEEGIKSRVNDVFISQHSKGIFVSYGKRFIRGYKGEMIIEKNNDKLSIRVYSSKPENMAIVDTLLRHTILGEKLKKYWENEGLDATKAKERLEEITPRARAAI